MHVYDIKLFEETMAEGWMDNCYENEEMVKRLCKEKGLDFERVKAHFKDMKHEQDK